MNGSSLPRVAGLFAVFSITILGSCPVLIPNALAAEPKWPTRGEEARDFELADLQGNKQKLSDFTENGPVVLLVLRGFPGYQCPICNRQVGQYIAAADKFQDTKATVLMVYPGPAEGLAARAEEFITGKTLPQNFHLLIDPDYTFTNAWNLRWDAPRETAYPSTFVIAPDGRIRFAKISKTHGDRAPAEESLKALSSIQQVDAKEPRSDSGAAVSILDRVRRHDFHPLQDGFTKDARLDRHGIAELSNDDWRVRTLAVRELVRIGSAVVPVLLGGLEDENLHVRHVSSLVLGILPADQVPSGLAPDRLRKLGTRLKDDPDPLVRSEAAIALGRIGDSSSVEVLKSAAESDSSRDVRHQCALAIDRIGKSPFHFDRSLFDAYRSLDESTFNKVSVGEPAVDFTLTDTEGRQWRLSDFRGQKPVVMIWIFADWCPVCHGEFHDLVQLKREFKESDIEVVTIQCHEAYRSRVMVGKELVPQYWFSKQAPQLAYLNTLWWSHLSDPAGAVGAMYGVSPLSFAVHSEYINRPATVIIDKDGIVRFAYYGTYWGDRPTIHQTLDIVRDGAFAFEHPQRLKKDSQTQ